MAGVRWRNYGESMISGEEECKLVELQVAGASKRRQEQELLMALRGRNGGWAIADPPLISKLS